MYRKSVLKNGLRVVSFQMPERDSVSIGIWCGVGGRFETDELKGAAHFLEHIVFKGTKNYSCNELKEQIEGVGGSLNAFTAEEHTCYYVKIPAKNIAKGFDVLADMVFYPKISKKDVESERGVILEEIKMYYDLPQYFVVDSLEQLMWPDHPLGKGLAGSIESVSGMTLKNISSFHNRYYIPNNIVVSACGHVSHEALVDMVRRKTKQFTFGQRISAQSAAHDQKGPRAAFYFRQIEQMHMALGVYGVNAFDKDRYALSLLNIIMGGNMSSRLFNEVREKRGLAYSIHSSFKSLSDTGLFLVRSGVDNMKVTQALTVILNEFKKVRQSMVTKSEFSRAKDYLIGQLLLGLEDTMEHMLWIGESTMVRDRIPVPDEIIRMIKAVKIEDITRVAATILNEKTYNLTVVGPIKKEQEKEMRELLDVEL
ncbi:MAG: pitrilysin family protein [Candidatus Omnitrophota bacterium]